MLDEIHLQLPFLGNGRLADELKDKGLRVNRTRPQRLMSVVGISAVSPKPRTARLGSGAAHRVYLYLLDVLAITRLDQVRRLTSASSHGAGFRLPRGHRRVRPQLTR